MRQNKKKVFGVGVLVALAIITSLLWLAYQFTFGPLAERRALAKLDRTPLANHISVPIADLDIVTFLDGHDGWFVVTDTAQIAQADIGFFGLRFMGKLFGGSHDPLHCGAGKSLYAVQGDKPIQELGYCSRRRMDFAELRPFAEPARWITESVPVKEALPRIAAIEQNPDQYIVETPHYYPDLDYEFTVTTPYYWVPQKTDEPVVHVVYSSIKDAFAATLPAGESRYALSIHDQIAYETPTVYDSDWNATEHSQPIIRVSGKDYTMPALKRIARYEIKVSCIAETCPALTTVDSRAVFAPYRDRAVLDEAYATRVPTDYEAATMPPPSPVTLPDLVGTDTTATDPAFVMLNVSYVEATAR